jgi:predicted RNase H-like nuclease (RuvC/YqgF family)
MSSSNTTETTSTNPNASGGISYARALNDAKSLIVRQSARIKSDAQKLRAQADEIENLRSAVEQLTEEMDRLRGLEGRLADVTAGREQAEALVGRQRIEIELLETASRELQRMLSEQAARINEMTAEAEQLRSNLPTEEDAVALEQMAALLSSARANARSRQQRAEQFDRSSGPALAQAHYERQQAAVARGREITIPAEPTPFCEVSERRAA